MGIIIPGILQVAGVMTTRTIVSETQKTDKENNVIFALAWVGIKPCS
jgi:hypothetical protein